MRSVNTHQAKTQLSRLLADVENKGETIVLCRNGKPVAELRPFQSSRSPLRRNVRLAKVKFREDPSLPLDPADWPPDDD
jgi:antitoxin (DNA-binding transcriptional repressor) of toxin-antitoxin stability system